MAHAAYAEAALPGVGGDPTRVERRLDAAPGLVQARSADAFEASLLHPFGRQWPARCAQRTLRWRLERGADPDLDCAERRESARAFGFDGGDLDRVALFRA